MGVRASHVNRRIRKSVRCVPMRIGHLEYGGLCMVWRRESVRVDTDLEYVCQPTLPHNGDKATHQPRTRAVAARGARMKIRPIFEEGPATRGDEMAADEARCSKPTWRGHAPTSRLSAHGRLE